MRKIIFITLFVLSWVVNAQRVTSFHLKDYRVSILDKSVEETSGLQFYNGSLYTINDSGNSPELFELNKENGKVITTIKLPFKNTDWEAITADENAIYIADSGNNYGNRKTLKIFRVPVMEGKLKVENYSEIPFYYPEQNDYSNQSHYHDFDCESMAYIDRQLHLFTKEWKSKKTAHYILSVNEKEKQPAKKLEDFDLGYLATDVSYYNGKLYMVGYTKKAKVYLTVFTKNEQGFFFANKAQKYFLGGAGKLGQVEGIEVNKDGLFISAEKLKYKWLKEPPSYYYIPWSEFNK